MSTKSGTISKLRNGRFWARAPLVAGKQKSLGTYATHDEANAALDAFIVLHLNRDQVSPQHITFAKFGASVLDQRELDGIRAVKTERRYFGKHLVPSTLGNMALQDISPMHVSDLVRQLLRTKAADKRGTRQLKRSTVMRILTVGSAIFVEAQLRGIVHTNPFKGMAVRKSSTETEDVWTFLNIEEQERLLSCQQIPIADRAIIAFALYTGIRQGELCHAYLRDLHLDGKEPHLIVRFGSKDKGPKNKKTRLVPLIPQALRWARHWVESIRPSYMRSTSAHEVRKDEGIIFPTVTGARRNLGKPLGNGWLDPEHPRATDEGWLDRMASYYALADIPDRPGLHWHALRHTCATSLLEGWWGPAWALEEVQQMLGHSSIAVTQRYAHHAGTRLRAAAQRMRTSDALVTEGEGDRKDLHPEVSETIEAPPARVELATNALGKGASDEEHPRVTSDDPHLAGGPVTTLAERVLKLLQEGKLEEAATLAKTEKKP